LADGPLFEVGGILNPCFPASGAISSKQEKSMARLLVLYKTPKDTAAFDEYYRSTHIALAQKLPGLRKYEISKGGISTPAGEADLYLVATLHFDSLADIQNALVSPEGKAAAGDLANFADGGVDLYFFETTEV